ncbi:zinc finger MYM-type protein 1-like [Rhopalosiphum padi]|uniref:zinc finger MYM-type protein 1-like n=1 Tax=Rhopalosiphum padi TaxID=40932 RepID=UPI00298E218B|nr:zinc finger MYM-type protein 1-like [Rhopalosiphum padi]
MEIKNKGRPTPDLNIKQITKCKTRDYVRQFKNDIYKTNDWICGCSETNRLYCFPCLLFGQKSNDAAWVKNGINDLIHLTSKIKTHEKSMTHINSQLNLKLLGKQDIRQQLSTFELALRGHDEKSNSENPGVFRGLINFSSELDSVLKCHIENSSVFKGLSKSIQNDLLECCLAVCQQRIKNEIKQAEYISVMADETTDVSAQFQLSIIFRYLLSDGTPGERFWGFFNPTGHDAKSLSECIIFNLEKVLKSLDMLICQSYDGANVMSGRLNGVQKIINNSYKNAHFIHCYAHQLNLILIQATSQNREIRIFFSNLTDITNFFSNSPQRVTVLDKIVKHRVPRSSNTRWNFKSRIVNTVYENLESLIECMKEIESTFNQTIPINQAGALHRMLIDDRFIFWLRVFHSLMPHVDILYNQLQKPTMDPVELSKAIFRFEENILKERQNIDNIFETSQNHPTKKRKHDDTIETRKIAAKEVCDIFIVNVKERFDYKNHLNASHLFLSTKFLMYENNFPGDHFNKTIEAYPFLDVTKLKTELQLFYKRTDFPEAERSFSTLKRIKTFLRNSMTEDRLTALAMLSIEKRMINNIPNFNEEVINRFAEKKERRIDLTYKYVPEI